jgi:hypothetical protein
MTGPSPKRRQSGQENPPTSARDIRPKPTSANGSPLPFTSATLPSAPQPKKRGRPSKADVELRQQEAIARGEVLPPPRTLTPKTLKPNTMRDEPIRIAFTSIAPMGHQGHVISSNEPTVTGHPYQGDPSASAATPDSLEKKKRVRPSARPKGSRISDLLESETDEAQMGPKQSRGAGSFQVASVPTIHSQQPNEQTIAAQSFADEPQPIRPKQVVGSMVQAIQNRHEEISRGADPSAQTQPPTKTKP